MADRPAVPAPNTEPAKCWVCKGHGDIWTNWHPTPVKCGHCNGTGLYDAETDRTARRAAREETT